MAAMCVMSNMFVFLLASILHTAAVHQRLQLHNLKSKANFFVPYVGHAVPASSKENYLDEVRMLNIRDAKLDRCNQTRQVHYKG